MINIDNNNKNADWIKSMRLDIPFIRTWKDLQKLLNIPPRGAERLSVLKNLNSKYSWVSSLPRNIRDAIADEVRRLEKNLKSSGNKDA